jgi:hypothetical protein
VYNGEPIGVENGQVSYELFQYGFGRVAPIRASFAQDGTFSAMLFDGEYKMIIPNGQGPFRWNQTAAGAPDTLVVNLKGSQTTDLQVTPYYMIRNPQITGNGTKVSAQFRLEKIITDGNARDVEQVGLYINKTQFVSSRNEEKIRETTMGGGSITDMNNIMLEVDVPSMTPTQNYVFARIGVKIAGVEDRLFSPVVKITF